MTGIHLTSREAAALFDHWHEKVEHRIRKAAAKAHGRQDRHHSELADLYRDLASVGLHNLLETDFATPPGTPARAVAEAVRFLAEAEQQHAWNAHKPALVRLQFAYTAANLAIELVDGPRQHTAGSTLAYPAMFPPTAPTQESARRDEPEDPGEGHLSLPIQRR